MTVATQIRIAPAAALAAGQAVASGADAMHLAMLGRTYAAFAAGDIPAVLEAFAPEALWECHGAPHLPWAGHWHGRAGLLDFFTALAAVAEVRAFAPGPIQVLPDGRLVAEGYERLRFRRSGVEATTRWLHVFAFRQGRIASGIEWNEGAVLAAAHRGG
jgi:ketosteroid isomerase-like protein